LIGLARKDGWGNWSSPEIAMFNRSVDSLVSLIYIIDFLSKESLDNEITRLIANFQPSKRKRLKLTFLIPILFGAGKFQKEIFVILGKDLRRSNFQDKVKLYRFILKTWKIRTIVDLSTLIGELESFSNFDLLLIRFKFWMQALSDLWTVTASDK
jgi:hypothetical protein